MKRLELPADFGERFAGLEHEPLFDVPDQPTVAAPEPTGKTKPRKTTAPRPGVSTMTARTGAPPQAPAVELEEHAAAQRRRYLELTQEISKVRAQVDLALKPQLEELAAIEAWFAERVPVGSEGLHEGATLVRWKTPRRAFSVDVAAAIVPASIREAAQVVTYDREALEKALTADQREICMVPGNGQPKVEIL